jgi:hypothetical protein
MRFLKSNRATLVSVLNIIFVAILCVLARASEWSVAAGIAWKALALVYACILVWFGAKADDI